ncbi:MAG: prepilin-type N-terminal cleavage/methylation domain-containing protein [Planctomycetota bacterium]|nr:prepilin-type N-terminal cleavage/methylation domain-containing protein [Planctomycetota bacterium]
MRSNQAVRVRGGFTLVEMIVTICVISLLMMIAMPGLVQLFRSGADAQAYNIASTELVNARVNALQKGLYSGVHFQAGDAQPGRGQNFYAAVVDNHVESTTTTTTPVSTFRLASGYMMQELPGRIAVGQATSEFVDNSGNYTGDFSDTNLPNFTSLTVVFGPQGSLVQTIPDATTGAPKPILFDVTADLFAGAQPLWLAATANGTGTGKNGVSAVCLFDYITLRSWEVGKRKDYLTQFAQVLPVNMYTGQLYERK